MLSDNQNEIQNLIQSELSGLERENVLLYHVSVYRKLTSVDMWLQQIKELTPNVIQPTVSNMGNVHYFDISSYLVKISAYIDAFFMSGKSTLDCFGHEIRSLYGLGDHSGDLYFENALDLLSAYHTDTRINSWLNSLDVRNSEWYRDLKSYRKACAHESIIQIEPSLQLDFLTGQWKTILLKLPLDPFQRPLLYNGKNFIETGQAIKDQLFKLILGSYDRIIEDIKIGKTKIKYNYKQ